MCILMPIYGKSIAPWVPAYPLLTGMIRQKPMAQLDVFVRGIPIFGTNPEMVLWLPIVSITYRPNCNWWYISFWIVKPYRSYIKFLWYQCDHFGIISKTIDLQYDTGFNRESWLAKIKYTKKKQSKTESPKSNTTGRITRKKSKQKHETQKKNKKQHKHKSKHGFSSVFFFCIFCILSLLLWFVFSVCSEFGFSLFYYLNCVKPYILYAVGLIILWYKLI
jgi:hypothetical protein